MSKKSIQDALNLNTPDKKSTDIVPSGEQTILPAEKSNVEIYQPDPKVEKIWDTYQVMVDSGKDALKKLLDISEQTQSPRGYEVAAQMIRAVLEANKNLLELYEKQKDEADMAKRETEEENKSTVNNNLFIGSTAELLTALQDMKKVK